MPSFIRTYLQPSKTDLIPWSKHIQGRRDLGNKPIGEPYSKEEILEYLEICWQQVKEQVASMDLDAPSGFGRLPPDKLEQQIYNIRHLQQHIEELCERSGAKSEVEVGWILKSE